MNLTNLRHGAVVQRKHIWPVLLFFLLSILSFPELFFKEETLYFNDITGIHYPLRIFAAQEWLTGRIPLWNPYVLSGFPMLAEGQIGIFYPINVLFLLPIAPYFALTLFVAIHISLAATFTYILACAYDMSRFGATLAGLCFGFGGFVMAQVTNLNVMTGAVWLPLIMAGWLYTIKSRSWAVAAVAGLPLALQILTTQPQITFYTLILLASYTLYQIGLVVFSRRFTFNAVTEIAKILGLFGVMVGMGLVLSAPQWLATLELQQWSIRSAGLSYETMIQFSLPLFQWLTLLLPGAFGGNTINVAYRGLSANFYETYVYAGTLPLLFAGLSWRATRRSEVIFWGVVLLVSGLLALGGYTPIYKAVQFLPGFSLFRVPARWLLMVSLSLALLAGWGGDAFLKHPPNSRLQWGLASMGIGLIMMAGFVWVWLEPLLKAIEQLGLSTNLTHPLSVLLQNGLFEPGQSDHLLLVGLLAWLTIPAIGLVCKLGLSITLLVGYAAEKISPRLFVITVLVFTSLDLILAGGSVVNPIKPASHWQQLSLAARHILEIETDNPGRLMSLASSEAELAIASLGQYTASIYRLPAATGHRSPLQLRRYSDVTALPNDLLVLALTGTRYLITDDYIPVNEQIPLKLIVDGLDGWHAYEAQDSLPRAFVVHQAVAAADPGESLELLQADSFDPSQRVILETDLPLPLLESPDAQADKVEITREEPTLVEIEAQLTAGGYLVLLDNFYPGWQVYVHGQKQPLLPANHFARAVYLAAGRSKVLFVYRPLSFRIGLGLCLVGLLFLMWVTFLKLYGLFIRPAYSAESNGE